MLKFGMMLCILSLFYVNVRAQVTAPAMSPLAKIYQKIGLSEVEVTYSRPGLRGRPIFGEKGILVENEFWRTGANGATKVELSDDIIIGGDFLPKGTYAILTKPGRKAMKIYFFEYKTGNWLSYLEQEPILVCQAIAQEISETVETFTISLDDLTLGGALLKFIWGNYAWSIPVDVGLEEKMLTMIDKEMSGPSLNDYFQAALYLHEAGIDLDRALEYIQKVTNRDNALFFQVYREALILDDLGRKGEALKAAERSKKLSQDAGNSDFVRLNEMLIEKLKI